MNKILYVKFSTVIKQQMIR